MTRQTPTLDLLEKIATANGVAIDDFMVPERRAGADHRLRKGRPYRGAVMLPRLVRAYWALPSLESRLRALRMMEAMADRAKDARDETALTTGGRGVLGRETAPDAATGQNGFFRKVSSWVF